MVPVALVCGFATALDTVLSHPDREQAAEAEPQQSSIGRATLNIFKHDFPWTLAPAKQMKIRTRKMGKREV